MCAIWFLLLGWEWVYFFNIVFVFPFAIVGFFLSRQGRAAERKLLNKIVGWLLVGGLVIAIGTLLVVLVYMMRN